MKKVKTYCGYDIYELTREECKEHYYVYPTFAVFYEGETYETTEIDESSFETVEEAEKWCRALPWE